MNNLKLLASSLAATTLTACSSMSPMAPMARGVPVAIAVPAGNVAVMTQMGAGDLTYECRAKANMAGQYEWAFVGPNAVLYGPGRTAAGKYYAGPTWESSDGSKVTGKQLAVSPGGEGAIPLQLVQANPATGSGTMNGVTYIQRVNTKGGVAPKDMCDAGSVGRKQTVAYEADYVFYKAR